MVVIGQVVETQGNIGVLWPKDFLTDCQRPLIKWLCLGIAALFVIEIILFVWIISEINLGLIVCRGCEKEKRISCKKKIRIYFTMFSTVWL